MVYTYGIDLIFDYHAYVYCRRRFFYGYKIGFIGLFINIEYRDFGLKGLMLRAEGVRPRGVRQTQAVRPSDDDSSLAERALL